ncbi:hypothetical protein M569_06880 [Genlisea aurea]|uniref:PSII 6.1 kDa protein n=1 Tax=Genlisea aurea TaxID=192259 RepID=S8CSN8_9LAMI|nr:hypothetical protein M569_06880 [Genlisea aurea]
MATIAAATASISIPRAAAVSPRKASAVGSSPVLGLAKGGVGRVRCSIEVNKGEGEGSGARFGAAAAVIAAAASASWSPSAVALVDERLSTEGTGLPFGVSNNLLVWILAGVFALIWSFYIVYTSSLDEDEESGLSL